MTKVENKLTTQGGAGRPPVNTSPGSGRGDDRPRRIAEAVQILAESFLKPVTPLTIRAYDVGTSDLPIEAVESAVMEAIKSRKFFPTVSELREMAGVVTPDARAVKAWLVAKTAVPVWGSYRSVDFDDPLVNATVRALGGWVEFCGTPAGEKTDTWLRKNFEATYKALMSSGVAADDVRPLRGLCAVQNGASGHDGPAVVRIACGLPEHVKRLVSGADSGGRSAGYLGADAKRIGRIE